MISVVAINTTLLIWMWLSAVQITKNLHFQFRDTFSKYTFYIFLCIYGTKNINKVPLNKLYNLLADILTDI